MLEKFFINMFFGALVGASTNALAIYYIFRFIVPRKKAEMASSVREVISEDLFSTDKIISRFESDMVNEQIYSNINNWLEELLERDLPSINELCADHLNDVDKFSRTLRYIIVEEIVDQLGSDKFREEILRENLLKNWNNLKDKQLNDIFPQLAKEIPGFINPILGKTLKSSMFRARISMTLGNLVMSKLEESETLRDVLPAGVIDTVLKLVGDQSAFMVEKLADAMEEPEVQKVISDTVCNAVHEQLSSQSGLFGRIKQIGAQFLGIDNDIRGVCSRLPNTIRKHFMMPSSQDNIKEALLKVANDYLDKDWRIALNDPSLRQIQELIYLGINTSLDNYQTMQSINDLTIGGIEKLLNQPIDELIGIEQEGKTVEQILTALQKLLTSSEMKAVLNDKVKEFIDNIRKVPIGRIKRYISEKTKKQISQLGVVQVRTIVIRRLKDFTQQTGLWDIVSESIEHYDNKEIEKMIRKIADQELRWVTWLGGIIGAFIGIIQTFISIL